MRIKLRKFIFFTVLLQVRGAKASSIFPRIFATIVPGPFKGIGEMRPHEFHGFFDRVDRGQILARNTVFCFKTK